MIATDGLQWVPIGAWFAIGVFGWLAVAIVVAVVVGQMIHGPRRAELDEVQADETPVDPDDELARWMRYADDDWLRTGKETR